MNSEDLKNLKIRINNLNENEKKLRDKYLRKIANGEMLGPNTGYASIDKTWLKYFDESSLNYEVPKKTIYQYMMDCTKDFDKNKIALECNGIKVSYGKLYKEIDRVASALIASGVKKGDVVSICLPNLLETTYLFYAVNKIGAISNMLDPRTSPEVLNRSVNSAKSNIVITLDLLKNVFIDSDAKCIVSCSALESFPNIVKKIILSKDKSLIPSESKSNKIIEYKEFIKKGKKCDNLYTVDYEPNMSAVIAYTGGTTGVSKGALDDNEAYTSMLIEVEAAKYPYSENDTAVNLAPPFTCYGLNNALNVYLCLGIKQVLIPKFTTEEVGDIIKKYKPNHMMGTPTNLYGVMNNKELDNFDMSFMKNYIMGGDKLDETIEKEFNEWLIKHNSNILLTKGYGMTEVSAGASCTRNNYPIIGSVGIPYLPNNFGIFDEDNNEILSNQKGEICIKSVRQMKKYFGVDEDKTSDVLKEHEDGVWVHTGDIGHFDQNGILYIDGRKKRLFMKYGWKIFPQEIENKILENDFILECAVIGKSDSEIGNKIIVYVKMKPGITFDEEKKNIIMENLKTKLFDYQMPDMIINIDEMPLTKMNKIDYKALEDKEIDEKKLQLIKF